MSKKDKSLKESAESLSKTGKSVMESAQQIWLAGLGAFGKAQKKGVKLFEELVQEGMILDQKTRKMTAEATGNLRESVESSFAQVKENAQENWGKFEKLFEDRLTAALKKLGIPQQSDLQSLEKRLDALQQQLQPKKPSPEARPAKPSAASVAHVVRDRKDDLNRMAKDLEEAQIAAKKRKTGGAPAKRGRPAKS